MKTFLNITIFLIVITVPFILAGYCESKMDPYEVGPHFDYSIECENGFIYKSTNHGTIQVLNSDGTPLRCGKKIY